MSRETQARATARPTCGEPVKRTLSTGAWASATPACAPAVDHPHEALGQARAPEHARDALAGEARPPGRLEDDGVARQQRAGELSEGLREGRAAGADHADHAERLEGHTARLAGT